MNPFAPASLRPVALAALLVAILPACRSGRPAPAAPSAAPVATAVPPRPAPPAAAPSPAAAPVATAAPAPAGWTTQTSVGRIVAERPATARVFERAGLDYCCGGSASLDAAAREKGLDPASLLREVQAVPPATPSDPDRSWVDAPIGELLTHIEATHHAYLREELPRLTAIVEKVREVHGAAHPELADVARTYARLAAALPPHLVHEETTVFPAVRALVAGDAAGRASAGPALERMRVEHDEAGAALHDLRRLTRDFSTPDDACALYRQMLLGLTELEADVHRHVHLENNVLLPRATALASR